MARTTSNSLRLFRFAGIDVFVHWSWAAVAILEIQHRSSNYSSLLGNILEYLALFVIVLMHEFGHALACKQVGGQANKILLWPLGGIAYVSPPARPGATLWSIAAGPLVNVFILVVLSGALFLAQNAGASAAHPEIYGLFRSIWFINLAILIFNMLPVYPLDGGQILRSLLWYIFGQERSLLISSYIGIVGALAFVALALYLKSPWLVFVAIFLLLQCRRGIKLSGALTALKQAPRRAEFECPNCKQSPLVGELWQCSTCKRQFDTFLTAGVCPGCSATYPTTACPLCRKSAPLESWKKGAAVLTI